MLTDTKAKAAKPGEKPYKLPDGDGLLLYVTPAGGKFWRWRYRWLGKEKTLSLGEYPHMGLGDARRARDDAKTALRAGTDPSFQKRALKAAGLAQSENTLEKVARAWHENRKAMWSERHADDVLNSLGPIFKALGGLPIADITPPLVLAELQKIEARGAIETAHRVRQRLSEVWVFAIAHGFATTDPAAMIKSALRPVVHGRQPAVTDLNHARELLRSVEATDCYGVTRLAHRWLVLTAVRPGEALSARWCDIDETDPEKPLWTIPAPLMKMKRGHLVPLSPQAVEVLQAIRVLGWTGDLIFPSVRSWRRPMSEAALESLVHRAGFHGRHVPHGWRATFSTILNELFPDEHRIIDLALAHAPKGKVEASYNRALHLDRRRDLLQRWAGLILEGARPAIALIGGPVQTHKGVAAEAAAMACQTAAA